MFYILQSSGRVKRYENIGLLCRSSLPTTDISHFVKHLSPLPSQQHSSHRLHMFMYPTPPNLEQEPGTSNSEYSSNAVSNQISNNNKQNWKREKIEFSREFKSAIKLHLHLIGFYIFSTIEHHALSRMIIINLTGFILFSVN